MLACTVRRDRSADVEVFTEILGGSTLGEDCPFSPSFWKKKGANTNGGCAATSATRAADFNSDLRMDAMQVFKVAVSKSTSMSLQVGHRGVSPKKHR